MPTVQVQASAVEATLIWSAKPNTWARVPLPLTSCEVKFALVTVGLSAVPPELSWKVAMNSDPPAVGVPLPVETDVLVAVAAFVETGPPDSLPR